VKGKYMQARKIKDLDGFTGEAVLFELDPPLEEKPWDENDKSERHRYVVVSATTAMMSGPETYIFPATKTGRIKDWGELPGSFRGGLSHEEALRRAGYSVVAPTKKK
jgi:hypothetical protein